MLKPIKKEDIPRPHTGGGKGRSRKVSELYIFCDEAARAFINSKHEVVEVTGWSEDYTALQAKECLANAVWRHSNEPSTIQLMMRGSRVFMIKEKP